MDHRNDMLSINLQHLIDERIKTVMKNDFAGLTNPLVVAQALDKNGTIPSSGTDTKEPSTGNELFVWGSRWGGSRIVGG